MLDLTWAQIKDILSNRPMFKRLDAGKGLDHSDMIRLQKLADGEAVTDKQPDADRSRTTF